ncbi:hypothetical protein D3C81_1483900 [compost metagenome]
MEMNLVERTGGLSKMDFRLSVGSNLLRVELGKLLYNMICEVLFVELIDYEAEVWVTLNK